MAADELLDALRAAAEDGDVKALLYLPAFERWVMQARACRTLVNDLSRNSRRAH